MLSADFLEEILQVRRELNNIFKVMEMKNLQQSFHSDWKEISKVLQTGKS